MKARKRAYRATPFATLQPTKPSKETRDFRLRGIPVELADKLKVADSLHRKPMREYMLEVLGLHLVNEEVDLLWPGSQTFPIDPESKSAS
ncbi:MAG TPA: hypothetical protein VIW47_11000 [Nitrospiraceae bacterium]